jgi:asparagine synthase (glutamine-hydrolysing)
MTAIAGFWSLGTTADPATSCDRMLRGQQIYGKASACWADDRIALGRRIYPRLPEDRFDHGPIVGGDGKLILVADIRIDNRAELVRDLDMIDSASACDTAVAMRAFERWGEDALQRLVGDFALALWQPARQRLLLARDFAGRVPLHYHSGDGFFAFASMPKGLHALSQIPRAVDEARALDFLGLMHNLGPASFFAHVDRVEPGHMVTITPQGMTERKFWNPDCTPLGLRSADDYAEALRDQLDQAVAARLRGVDGVVATHLSGGLDSAAVTATAARLLHPAGGSVVAFTAVPRAGDDGAASTGRIADEGPLAAATAAFYPNIEHVRLVTGGQPPTRSLDRYLFLYERPLLNLCNAVWLEAINSEAQARKLTVLLTGDLGNQTMSYSGEHLLTELFSRGRLISWARESAALHRSGTRFRSIGVATIGPLLPNAIWRRLARLRGLPSVHDFIAARRSSVDQADFQRRMAERGIDFSLQPLRDGVTARLRALARADSGNHNKGALAGWGIDIREPTADRRLVEFCLRVPIDQYLQNGVFRSLARRALADRLPPAVVNETRRGQQAADWHAGMDAARPEIAATLDRLSAVPFARATFDLDRLQSLIEHWPDDWSDEGVEREYRFALLRAVSLGHFVGKVTGTNG